MVLEWYWSPNNARSDSDADLGEVGGGHPEAAIVSHVATGLDPAVRVQVREGASRYAVNRLRFSLKKKNHN